MLLKLVRADEPAKRLFGIASDALKIWLGCPLHGRALLTKSSRPKTLRGSREPTVPHSGRTVPLNMETP